MSTLPVENNSKFMCNSPFMSIGEPLRNNFLYEISSSNPSKLEENSKVGLLKEKDGECEAVLGDLYDGTQSQPRSEERNFLEDIVEYLPDTEGRHLCFSQCITRHWLVL